MIELQPLKPQEFFMKEDIKPQTVPKINFLLKVNDSGFIILERLKIPRTMRNWRKKEILVEEASKSFSKGKVDTRHVLK